MTVTLLGAGCGFDCLTGDELSAVQDADLLIGAPRVLSLLGEVRTEKREMTDSKEILEAIINSRAERICILFSGDSGFYSGAKNLVALLKERNIPYRVLPGISSLQMLSARLGMSWQDWNLCSAHGVDADILCEVMKGRPCFFLTGGKETPSTLCTRLTEAGLGKLKVAIGEDLGQDKENIFQGYAEDFAGKKFAPLSVLLTEAAPIYEGNPTGIADEEFIRTKVPMTKREVRSFIPGALNLQKEDLCWDIGAGTGSVSVELALKCKSVWAMEKDPEALDLISKNREKFLAWNLHVVASEAPRCLAHFPTPDAVFVGGSGGELGAILDAALAKNPEVKICISAITVETLVQAVPALECRGLNCEVVQISVSRTKCAGKYHLLMAQNPTFLIYGQKKI